MYYTPERCLTFIGSTKTHERGEKQEVGSFIAWICAECGLTEWFAVGVQDTLARLARMPTSGGSLVEHERSAR